MKYYHVCVNLFFVGVILQRVTSSGVLESGKSIGSVPIMRPGGGGQARKSSGEKFPGTLGFGQKYG